MGHLHWRNYIMLLKKLKSKLDCLFFFFWQVAIRCRFIILSMRFVSAQKCRAFSQLKQQRGPQNIMKQYGIKKCRFSGFSNWQTVVQKCIYTFGTIEILSYFAKCTNKTVQKLPITVYFFELKSDPDDQGIFTNRTSLYCKKSNLYS